MILPLENRATGTVTGSIVLGLSPYRELDEDYRAFCRSVAQHVSTALTDALAYEVQRRRAEELTELDAAKTRFLENVSHELRTPLTLILGSLGAIRQEGRAYREDVDIAERGALRLERLVDSLLEFARSDANQLHAVLEPTDLATVTADVASMFRAAIERAGMRLVVRAPPLSRPVEVDPEMWVQIVANLVSNAVKFTPSGTISVQLREAGEDVVLTVTDTGVGVSRRGADPDLPAVPPGARDHRPQPVRAPGSDCRWSPIWPRRTRARLPSTAPSASAPRSPSGCRWGRPYREARPVDIRTGLAAAFRAEAEGWIGATDSNRPPEPEQPLPESAHVLLVEDNADMRAFLTRLLRADGWHVTAVADAAAALRMSAPPPDLLLSDVMLPGTDGLELVRRAAPAAGDRPGILMSRFKIGDDESFTLLRETSQRLNRKLRDSDEVVLTGELPT